MFGWFSRKKEIKKIKEETKKGFESVKKDMIFIRNWVKNLDSEKDFQKREMGDLKQILSSIKSEIEEIKNSELRKFKMPKEPFNKQTAVYAVQTGVQTGVQTPNFNQFSMAEKAILWVLLNTDMKLSYDDLAALLGKERSTIRGQINAVKQKSERLIQESIEKNGKKRVFIYDGIKEKMLKKPQVRVGRTEKNKKTLKKVNNLKKIEQKRGIISKKSVK